MTLPSNSNPLLLHHLWQFILINIPLIDHILFPSFVALSSFHVCCICFSIWDWKQNRKELPTILFKCALPQIIAHIIVNSLSFYVIEYYLQIPRDLAIYQREAPSIQQFIIELILCYIIGDFFIYWEHRLMHYIPFLRLNIHSTHHTFTSPLFSYAAGYVHPIEISIAIMCEMSFPILYGVHPLTKYIFIATWVFWLTEEHSGHHFWWSLYEILRKYGGGSKPHDIHHAPLTTKNLAFIFTFWDHLFGTFVDADEITQHTKQKNQQQQQKVSSPDSTNKIHSS
jgi:sterol desaturase/sphingolipid hydroxylase (fatty acid hydroxylase superfamily)